MTEMSLTMEQVLQRARPVLPVLVIEEVDLALDLAAALQAGGIEVLEVCARRVPWRRCRPFAGSFPSCWWARGR